MRYRFDVYFSLIWPFLLGLLLLFFLQKLFSEPRFLRFYSKDLNFLHFHWEKLIMVWIAEMNHEWYYNDYVSSTAKVHFLYRGPKFQSGWPNSPPCSVWNFNISGGLFIITVLFFYYIDNKLPYFNILAFLNKKSKNYYSIGMIRKIGKMGQPDKEWNAI